MNMDCYRSHSRGNLDYKGSHGLYTLYSLCNGLFFCLITVLSCCIVGLATKMLKNTQNYA